MTPAIMDSKGTNLFPNFLSRDDCRRATPPFEAGIADATWPQQTWADPNAVADGDGNSTYFRLPNPGESNALVPFKLPTLRAKVLNLPGVPIFQAYIPVPTNASMNVPNGPATPINVSLVSTLDQAKAMQVALGYGAVAEQTQTIGAFPEEFSYPDPGDPRRVYVIVPPWPNALPLNVGQLLASQNALGVGVPGSWSIANPAGPVWVPGPVNSAVGAGIVPTPAKPLAPGQSIMMTMFGIAIYVTI